MGFLLRIQNEKINKFNLLTVKISLKFHLLRSIFSRETYQFSQGAHAVACKCDSLLSLEKPGTRVFLNAGLYSKLIHEAHTKELGSLCFHPLREEIETPVYCFLEEYSDSQTIGFFCPFYWDCAKGTKTLRLIKHGWEPSCTVNLQHFSPWRIDPPALVSEWKAVCVI